MNIVKSQIPVDLYNPYKVCKESMFTLADIMVYYDRYIKDYLQMSITFSPLCETMEKRKLPKGYLREKVGLSPATVARIFKNEPVSFEVLDRICSVMEVQIQDVIKYEEEPFNKAKPRNTLKVMDKG